VNRRWQILLLTAFFFLLFAHGPAHAQTAKRLVLKDGSYQLASRWDVTGDRVRYFSTERNEWEEVPVSMVDWQATANFEKERESQRNLELKQSEEEEKSEANPATLSIAPGIHLPNSGGVYLLDTYNGELQLAELSQTNGEVSRQSGRNILRGAFSPLGSSKAIELKGEHARIQSHLLEPTIFLDIGPDPETQSLSLAERFRIARLEAKKDARVVANLKVAITGKVSQQEFYLPATAEQLPGGWIRLKPSQPLSPGEYAVVEMLGPKTMNLFVWDFGVNPSSPENSEIWKAAPQPGPPANSAASPDLQGRSH
jgi:hypothetical protein